MLAIKMSMLARLTYHREINKFGSIGIFSHQLHHYHSVAGAWAFLGYVMGVGCLMFLPLPRGWGFRGGIINNHSQAIE